MMVMMMMMMMMIDDDFAELRAIYWWSHFAINSDI